MDIVTVDRFRAADAGMTLDRYYEAVKPFETVWLEICFKILIGYVLLLPLMPVALALAGIGVLPLSGELAAVIVGVTFGTFLAAFVGYYVAWDVSVARARKAGAIA